MATLPIMPPTPAPVPASSPVLPFERQREDARGALLARIIARDRPLPAALPDGTPRTLPSGQASLPAGLVQARILQTNPERNEAEVEIEGQVFSIRSRVPLPENGTVLLRLPEADDELSVAAARGRAAQAVIGQAVLPDEVGGQADGQDRAEFSPTGRLLAQLSPQSRNDSAPAAQVRLGTLPEPNLRPDQTAQVLRQGIERSGLFYESHLRDWVGGDRSLTEVAQEPQARLAVGTDGTIPAAMRPLVQEQLQAIEHGRLAVQAQIAGQNVTLEVDPDEEKPQAGSEAAGPGRAYARLRLETGHLGPVELRLRVDGSQVSLLGIEAPSDSRQALLEALEELARSLEARGIALDSGTVPKSGAGP